MPEVRLRRGGRGAASARSFATANSAAAILALGLALVVAACATPAPSATPAPTPSPTPVPTATPLPGQPLPAGFRPEGGWLVQFARPGDVVREIYILTLTCPDGACDAIVQVLDLAGAEVGKGTFVLRDDRYAYEAGTSGSADCEAGGLIVRDGANRRVDTSLVIATFRIAGTATERQSIQGSRTVTIEPKADSGCAPSSLVYPALGQASRAAP